MEMVLLFNSCTMDHCITKSNSLPCPLVAIVPVFDFKAICVFAIGYGQKLASSEAGVLSIKFLHL